MIACLMWRIPITALEIRKMMVTSRVRRKEEMPLELEMQHVAMCALACDAIALRRDWQPVAIGS